MSREATRELRRRLIAEGVIVPASESTRATASSSAEVEWQQEPWVLDLEGSRT